MTGGGEGGRRNDDDDEGEAWDRFIYSPTTISAEGLDKDDNDNNRQVPDGFSSVGSFLAPTLSVSFLSLPGGRKVSQRR